MPKEGQLKGNQETGMTPVETIKTRLTPSTLRG